MEGGLLCTFPNAAGSWSTAEQLGLKPALQTEVPVLCVFNSVTVAADFLFSSIYEKLKPDSNESSHTVLRPAVQCCKTW